MMSIKQSSLHYHSLAKPKAEQDESLERRASSPLLTRAVNLEASSCDAFEAQAPVPEQAREQGHEQKGNIRKKVSLTQRLNPFKRPKKTTEAPKKTEISPELLTLAAAGYLSTLNPALAAGLASKIDSQFFWDFTILDFVGMGFPRISRSLQRGAVPYDPLKDPEAQKRSGLDKWFYIRRKKAENANWPNLGEEMMREIQAAPGSLLVPALVFGLLPFVSRNKYLSWTGRRNMLMSEQDLMLEHQNLQQFLTETTPLPPRYSQEGASLEALGKGYVERVFKGIPEPMRHEQVAIEIKGNGVINPYYHMSKGHLKTLQKGLNDDELFGLKQALNRHPQLTKTSSLSLKNVTLAEVVEAIAEVQGKLLAFDVQHGAGAMFFNAKHRQEHALLTAKMQALFNIAEATVMKVNAIHCPETRMQQQMTHLPTMNGTTYTPKAILHHLQMMDKGRDLMVATFRRFFAHSNNGKTLQETLSQSLNTAKATKAFITLGSFMWMMSWLWYLSHAIQRGREYPANRLVMFNKPTQKSTQAPVPSEGLPLTKKDATAEPLKVMRSTPIEEGKAS
jgi:hypothetical protein